MASSTPTDKVQALQRTLYRTAKADPGRRFHALYDKVYRRDVLERAWSQVRANQGAPGIDSVSIADVGQYGVSRMLNELATDLKTGSWRPMPARRVWIPKPGSDELRPLSIPSVRDRVVQAAAKIVLEPVFEADFLPCSFGFRPKRSAHDALQVLIDEAWAGRRWVVETDIASCFEAIPHDKLMQTIEERVSDRQVLKLLRAMLSVGVMEHGTVTGGDAGTPQGGVISPLLANIYLNRVDRAWVDVGRGVMVRYADDLIVMCNTRQEAETALATLTAILADLELTLKASKTQIVHLTVGGKGFDFLGFHHRWVQAKRARHVQFLARWPSDKAMQNCRNRIRELTARPRLLLEVEEIVGDLNSVLRGWAGYFRYGNSAERFTKIRNYALMRIALVVAKQHQQPRGYGWHLVAYRSPNQYGLICLDGTVVAPRPGRDWRAKLNAAGERRR